MTGASGAVNRREKDLQNGLEGFDAAKCLGISGLGAERVNLQGR